MTNLLEKVFFLYYTIIFFIWNFTLADTFNPHFYAELVRLQWWKWHRSVELINILRWHCGGINYTVRTLQSVSPKMLLKITTYVAFLLLLQFYQITYTCVRLVGFGFKAWFRMQVLNFHLTYYVVFKTMIKLCRLLKLNGHSLYSIPLLVLSIKFEFTVICRLQMQTNNWRILFSSLLTSNY